MLDTRGAEAETAGEHGDARPALSLERWDEGAGGTQQCERPGDAGAAMAPAGIDVQARHRRGLCPSRMVAHLTVAGLVAQLSAGRGASGSHGAEEDEQEGHQSGGGQDAWTTRLHRGDAS